jgi:hypothetical protein
MVDVRTQAPAGRALAPPQDDWPTQAADAIERVVGNIRDKTTGPALTASRAIVYGTFAAIVGVAALVVVIVALVRFVNVYLPGDVWAAHLLLGVVFSGAGAFTWARRRPAVTAEDAAPVRR